MKRDVLQCTTCDCCNRSLFGLCNQAELSAVNEVKTDTIFKKGQLIFFEGGYANGLYCLRDGKVKLYKTDSDGREHINRLARPGDILGYRTLVGNLRYNVSAAVLETAKVCFVPKDTFYGLLKSNERVNAQIMQMINDDAEQAETHLLGMAYKPVRGRLAEALLLLKNTYEPYDENRDENGSFSMAISREDLSGLVGTARETIIRLLSEFKRENLIRTRGSRITIIDPEGLVGLCDLYD